MMKQSTQTSPQNKQVLSYTEFFILCISGPVLFFSTMAIVTYFPKILSIDYAIQITLALQGVIALKFILKRDPELATEIAEASGGRYDVGVIRFFVVISTTMGSLILLVLPFYVLFKLAPL